MALNNPVTSKDGPEIMRDGVQMTKRPDVVYLMRLPEFTTIETNEGILSGHKGDWVAYDPMSRHVWPVSNEYVEMHYDRV